MWLFPTFRSGRHTRIDESPLRCSLRLSPIRGARAPPLLAKMGQAQTRPVTRAADQLGGVFAESIDAQCNGFALMTREPLAQHASTQATQLLASDRHEPLTLQMRNMSHGPRIPRKSAPGSALAPCARLLTLISFSRARDERTKHDIFNLFEFFSPFWLRIRDRGCVASAAGRARLASGQGLRENLRKMVSK